MIFVMWDGRIHYNSLYLSMLMFIRCLAFWENSFPRKILENFVTLEFNQNRSFYKLNKLTSKVLWYDLKLELVTIYYGWLTIKQESKTQIDLNTHSTTNIK